MTTLLAGGLLLGVLVFVHELGHFLVAKACGVRVLVFSLGFGPRLFGFRRGDTDYRVSAIPLGGYVRMFGDDVGEEIPEEERHRSFLHKPTLQKSAIAFAGPAANFLLPVALFFALFVGQETTSGTLVGTVVPGEPAAEAGLLPGDRLVEVEGRAVTTFREVQKIVEARPGLETRLVVERDGQRVLLSLVPRGAPSLNPLEQDKELGRVGIMPHV
jgi:regulator of sigma E protease